MTEEEVRANHFKAVIMTLQSYVQVQKFYADPQEHGKIELKIKRELH